MRTPTVLVFAGLAWSGATLAPAVATAQDDQAEPGLAAMAGLSQADGEQFAARFEREVWPLLTREAEGRKSCVGCHGDGPGNKSALLLAGNPAEDFAALLVDGYFDSDNPVSLLAKITHDDRKFRMPPGPGEPWTDEETQRLRSFVREMNARRGQAAVAADEAFPPALLSPFDGQRADEGPGNTFLSYWQLKGKVRVLFGDDWRRNERDLFLENLAQFGGADFVRRFDESTKASPSYLSALDTLGRDVASKAYLNRTGPFERVRTDLPEPSADATLDPAYREEINRLFRALLYRDAAEGELEAAFAFIKDMGARRAALAGESYEVSFELQVEDADGLRTTQAFSIPVANDPRGLYQQRVDQKAESPTPLARKALDATFHFDPADGEQTLRVSNADTDGNVSVHGYAIRRVGDDRERVVTVKDEGVRLEGAWRFLDRDDITTAEDGNDNKGASFLTLPIAVEEAGEFEVALLFRKSGGDGPADRRGRRGRRAENATNVLVEVVSHDPSRLEQPVELPRPPAGEAHFLVDQTVDNIAFWDLKSAFRFESDAHHVEVNNKGTKLPVVADAVRFTRPDGQGGEILIDDPKAEGREQWKPPGKIQFRPYNITGRSTLTDNGEKESELALRYVPTKVAEGWDKEAFYRVGVGFPGKAGNETRAPIVVRAAASSPIVRVQSPRRAHVGAEVTLDAGGTYNLQGTPLKMTWVQVGGPEVHLPDPHAPRATFEAPTPSPRQAAWEGLARALIAHPDFLFTRPVSLGSVREPRERARLQLVKIALDLAGRPPTAEEVARLDAGATLAEMVDAYLESPDFRDFYFHRIRLYLESQGTEEEDEPVRIWSYVALNDRPFQEILTADYTVGPDLRKRDRPDYHGRTGILTTKGFIKGKPGLPHFNYAAQVAEKFLGYVFEVPPEIVAAREGITATATTDPNSLCYSCHKILTPLAYQREAWSDDGAFRPEREGKAVDDSDHDLVDSYPFKGKGLQSFAVQAQKKERFIRTMINTHFVFFFGREMRHNTDERALYKRLWDAVHASNFTIRGLIRALVLSPEYLDGDAAPAVAAAE